MRNGSVGAFAIGLACQLEPPTPIPKSEPGPRPVTRPIIDAGVDARLPDLEEVAGPRPWVFRETIIGIAVDPRARLRSCAAPETGHRFA
jgi:hypothetical protein